MEEIKIEIGEYVRTKNGYISKNTIKEHKHIIDGIINQNEKYKYEFDNIEKHSKSIMDLIEIGDYVNGEKVIEVHLDLGDIFVDKETELGTKTFCNYQIESIVTHERFEQMEYKLEE